jgi:hypothetical protein
MSCIDLALQSGQLILCQSTQQERTDSLPKVDNAIVAVFHIVHKSVIPEALQLRNQSQYPEGIVSKGAS